MASRYTDSSGFCAFLLAQLFESTQGFGRCWCGGGCWGGCARCGSDGWGVAGSGTRGIDAQRATLGDAMTDLLALVRDEHFAEKTLVFAHGSIGGDFDGKQQLLGIGAESHGFAGGAVR